MKAVAAVVVVSLLALWPVRGQAAEPFSLGVVATTMTQIVLQWGNPPANTAAFELQRATDSAFTQDLKTYQLDKTTLLFSDTNRPPVSKTRFTGSPREPLLDRNTTYYYRVRAVLEGSGERFSNVVQGRVSAPVRGVAGDLWADVVLGKSGFGENVIYQPTRNGLSMPGGIVIDRSVTPNRMYIADCNNNRILGFRSTSPTDGADIVIGQPDFSTSAGNGDSCAQTSPYWANASATSLCLTYQDQISMSETVVRAKMAVDDEGNLYVPDVFNHRVLKYNDPFSTDCVADEVWGQADFSGNKPNRGESKPADNTFRFGHRVGLTIDPEGNLWVADSDNNRVLRFAKSRDTGVIGKEADLVLGQPDFTSNTEGLFKRTLAQLWWPADVEFDSNGTLYVCDGAGQDFDGRILVFEPPFKSGMTATRRMPMPSEDINLAPDRKQAVTIGSMRRDVNPDNIWFEKGTGTTELMDLRNGKSITSIWNEWSCGIDVDSDGNSYDVSKWYGLRRYPVSSWGLPWKERERLRQDVFTGGNAVTAGSTGGITGITTFKDQLIITSNSRALIWNGWNVNGAKNGQAADDVYGEKDFSTISWQRYLYSPQEDKSGRLWLCQRQPGDTLYAFAYPLTRDSKPMKSVKNDSFPVKGGGTITAGWADFKDFAVVGTGDKIWVADRGASRVYRMNNIDGVEDPTGTPYVDIVLGQNNLTDSKVHMGKDHPSAKSLAWPYNVDISPKGELVIADNGGECGTDQRILIYNAGRFPDNPDKCLFPEDIGDPDRVLGTGGKLDVPGSVSDDPTCSPFEVAISANGAFVVGNNAYSAARYPFVYLDPSRSTEPQIALGDLTAYPTTCFVDKEGNVYIGDWDWSRVLIYKKPFEKMRY